MQNMDEIDVLFILKVLPRQKGKKKKRKKTA
jgi:hypothetical protein